MEFWTVMLGRGDWQPVFLQPVAFLCFDALLMLAIKRRPWALAACCGWLALLVQLHYLTAAYLVLLPIGIWRARHGLRPVRVLGALVAGLLPLLPFLVYELNPAVQLRDVWALLGRSGATAQVDFTSVLDV